MNKSVIYSVLAFLGGAALGGLVGWKYSEKKYEAIAQEEINSVKEKFTVPRSEKKSKIESEKNPDGKNLSDKAKNKPSLVEYTKKLKDGSYINYSNKEDEPPVKKKKTKKNGPYVIDPNEYGENKEYSQVSLTLYADGILADEDDKIINAEEVVGDALEHIGDYEDDAVHVCNPDLKVYYEIIENEQSYEEVTNKDPHLDDGED